MTAPPKPPQGKGKPGKDPFGPPLEPTHVREFFRRLGARPPREQEAFVARVNWNLVDAGTEHELMSWLLAGLTSGEGARVEFVLTTLDKLPHSRRARSVPRFQAAMASLDPAVCDRLQRVFGPVLGGPPRRPRAPALTTAPPAPAATPTVASGEDLEALKTFFERFGGGAR